MHFKGIEKKKTRRGPLSVNFINTAQTSWRPFVFQSVTFRCLSSRTEPFTPLTRRVSQKPSVFPRSYHCLQFSLHENSHFNLNVPERRSLDGRSLGTVFANLPNCLVSFIIFSQMNFSTKFLVWSCSCYLNVLLAVKATAAVWCLNAAEIKTHTKMIFRKLRHLPSADTEKSNNNTRETETWRLSCSDALICSIVHVGTRCHATADCDARGVGGATQVDSYWCFWSLCFVG